MYQPCSSKAAYKQQHHAAASATAAAAAASIAPVATNSSAPRTTKHLILTSIFKDVLLLGAGPLVSVQKTVLASLQQPWLLQVASKADSATRQLQRP
jgi:hypothetical protein